MTTRAQATAAPMIIKFGEEEYHLSPMRDRDFGAFERWLQDRHIELAKRSFDGLAESLQEKLLKHAFDTAAQLTIGSMESLAHLKSVEGAGTLVWIMLRREHPTLTRDKVLELMTDPENLATAMESIDRIVDSYAKKGVHEEEKPQSETFTDSLPISTDGPPK